MAKKNGKIQTFSTVRKSLNTHGTLSVYLLCRLLTASCFPKNRFGEIVNIGCQSNSKVQSTLISRSLDLLCRRNELSVNGIRYVTVISRGNDIISRGNDLLSRGNDLLSRGNDIISGGNNLLSRWNDLWSRGNDLLNRGNNLKSRGNDILSWGNDYWCSSIGWTIEPEIVGENGGYKEKYKNVHWLKFIMSFPLLNKSFPQLIMSFSRLYKSLSRLNKSLSRLNRSFPQDIMS